MMAEDFGFCAPSYGAPMTLQDAESCINFYVEVAEVKGAKMPVALLGTPGLNAVASAALGAQSLYSGTLSPVTSGTSVGLVASPATLLSGTLIVGTNFTGEQGYFTGTLGSLTPNIDSNGNTVSGFTQNQHVGSAHGLQLIYTAAPGIGQNYIASVTLSGPGITTLTLAVANAAYTLSGGFSMWVWPNTVNWIAGASYSLTVTTSGSTFGSIAPATDALGNTIYALYQTGQGTTVFTLSANTNLGASYLSTLTVKGMSFSSSVAVFSYSPPFNIWTWIGTPGLIGGVNASVTYSINTATIAPVRGAWVLPGGTKALVVIGNALYVLTGLPFVLTFVGLLNTSSGPVCIRDNGAPFGGFGGFAVIVDGPFAYYYNLSGTSQTVFTGSLNAGSPTLTFPGVMPAGLVMAGNATLSALSGAIPAGTTIVGANYANPALTMSANATGNVPNDTITLTVPAFGQITDPGFLGSYRIAFIEGWLIFAQPSSRVMYSTGPVPYSVLFPGTSFALKDSSSDNISTIHENNRELVVIGERTSEYWYNAGNAVGFPFNRIPGVGPQIGCSATNSISRVGQNLVWLAKNSQGENYVVMGEEYTPTRISTHGVDHALASYSTIADAVAYSYEEDGHLFYVLNLPTADVTWVYDHTASQNLGERCWHRRASMDSNGIFHRHRSNCYLNFLNTRLVGDYQNGIIYQMSRSFYSDNGQTLRAEKAAKHIWSPTDRKRVFHSQLQVEFTPGVGLQSGQGVKPKAILQWSNDGGFTWSNEYTHDIGHVGQTHRRCIWRRLGFARDRVYKLAITDPVARDIIGVTLFSENEAA
jgi:hypothetical protein